MDTATKACPLFPLRTAAQLLSVPVAWLRGEADAGRVPCLRAGSAYLFDLDLVERLLLERARLGGGPPNAA
jgi:hypothetical protein